METSGLHRPKVSFEFILITVFLAVLAFRVLAVIGTLRVDYLDDVFRVGVIPWSDARGWVEGAAQVLRGEQISGMATCRPLYPLFLAAVLFIVKSSYLGAVYVQLILSGLAIAAAYYLLKPVNTRPGVCLFLSFLSIWRIEVPTQLMTENLGMISLMIGFALMWRGISKECDRSTLSGIFLLGLSQAVRPWCVITLATVPFFCFFSPRTLKDKFKRFILHALLVSLGFGLHPAAEYLFNKPGERYANNLLTLYGQVAGGKGWMSAYSDPVIKDALERNYSSEEVNHILFKRIMEIFRENPTRLIEASIESCRSYLSTIPNAFESGRKETAYFPLLFLLFALSDILKIQPKRFSVLPHRLRGLAALVAAAFLSFFHFEWFWTLFSLTGLAYALYRPREQLNAFMLLYFAGILLTLPLVGKDGGLRVRLAGDILIYFSAALGCQQVVERFFPTSWGKQAQPDAVSSPRLFFHPAMLCMAVAAIFLAVPAAIRSGQTQTEASSVLKDISAEEIAGHLGLDVIPLNPKAMEAVWHQWPNASFEQINGRMAYYPIRYSSQDTVYLNSNQGFSSSNTYQRDLHWPLSAIAMKRTILILESKYTLFPGFTPEDLESCEGKEIAVVGYLVSRPRPFMYATAFVLSVTHIISIDESGNLKAKALSILSR